MREQEQDIKDLLEEVVHEICKRQDVPPSQLNSINTLAIAHALRPTSSFSAELSAAVRRAGSASSAFEIYDRNLNYIKQDIEMYVQTKVDALQSGSFVGLQDTAQASPWPLHCSIRNVSTFQDILPAIVRTRRRLWENDEPDGKAVVSIVIETSKEAKECVVDGLLDTSPLNQSLLKPLAGSEIITFQPSVFEALPVFERDPRTDERGTWFPVRGLVQFVGRETRELGIAALDIETPCGGFREAITLILTGIWMGRASFVSTQRIGRPLSVVQEFLLYCVLEEHEIGGKRKGEPGFYESIHSRWVSLRSRLLVHAAGHPRLKGIGPETTNSVKAVRASLDRALASVERTNGLILSGR